MIFDSKLSFEKQITNVVQSCIYHLRSISKIRSFLSQPDLEKVIHACTSSRLHYCNALYSGLSKKAISGLQLVQNAAARLLTNTRRQEHISPVLAFLHWLQISFRIDFNISLINFKALHGSAPSYIADMPLHMSQGAASDHLAGLCWLFLSPCSGLKEAGPVKAPQLWNSLPDSLRLAESVTSYHLMHYTLSIYNLWNNAWHKLLTNFTFLSVIYLYIDNDERKMMMTGQTCLNGIWSAWKGANTLKQNRPSDSPDNSHYSSMVTMVH